MAYFIEVFSPETYERFSNTDRTISGVKKTQEAAARRIQPGDKLICYLTKLSRWVGVLEVAGDLMEDSTPLFSDANDEYVVRFQVKPLVWFDIEHAIPIREDMLWNNLSFTKDQNKAGSLWTSKFRSSMSPLSDEDGHLLEQALNAQSLNQIKFPFDQEAYEKLRRSNIRRGEKIVSVSVPQDDTEIIHTEIKPILARESFQIQAKLAEIGEKMGYSIWLPRNDRSRVLELWNAPEGFLLSELPLNYDETTIKTIEQIDVLWLKKRTIVRAFEVEHTTSVYSGILRMADLLALQPNMRISLHIVAPIERREKVFQEIQRPIFSLLEPQPLAEICTYLAYDAIEQLHQEKHLSHLSATVVDDFAEIAE